MKFFAILSCILLIGTPAVAQIELVSGDYFPAELEFAELQKVISEEKFDDASRLAKVEAGNLISDVGFTRYAKRLYSAGNSQTLSIEILTLLDSRASYSLLTLLRSGNIQDGPPGDAFTRVADGILFAQGKQWVRIRGRGTPEDLPARVATSVSNRIGPRRIKPPSLVTHLPGLGLDRSSLRYYPGVKAFASYSPRFGGKLLKLPEDAEIVQAGYSLENHAGTLTLLSFPTAEVAEEYYEGLAGLPGKKSYLKKTGPMVGILEGSFDPGSADRILSSIRYSYSVQWVYKKVENPKTVWGIPAGILTTVVKSLFFVVLLFGFSILVGLGFAAVRAALRRRAAKLSPDQQDETEITRLRMR